MNQQGENKIMIIDASKPVELEHAWCLWFDRYIGRGFTAHEYADAIKKVFEVKTIQEFWRWYNNLPGAAALDPSCTYHLMKSGIRPLWFVFLFNSLTFLIFENVLLISNKNPIGRTRQMSEVGI